MAFDTLERTPPPFFRQGLSATARLLIYSGLALLLMALDAHWRVAAPLRQGIDLLLRPLQLVADAPVAVWDDLGSGLHILLDGRAELAQLRSEQLRLSLAVQQSSQLAADNAQLRQLLALQKQTPVESIAAEIATLTTDPYSRKLLLDRGSAAGIQPGAPVIDVHGLLGQVTQLQAGVALVTLLTDRDSSVPVLLTRTGQRGVLVGDGSGLLLLWQSPDSDIRHGDQLVTSGIDGIYPPGLAVAMVDRFERQADSAFARVSCVPLGQLNSGRAVLVLRPLSSPLATAVSNPTTVEP